MSSCGQSNQKTIALLLGVSQSAVSLALSGRPGVSSALRDTIVRAARQQGYSPVAEAQRLVRRRHVSRRSANGSVIAWINQEDAPGFWNAHPISRAYWRGAASRASELGYRLEPFWLKEEGIAPGRLFSILHARGIEGILLPLYAEVSLIFRPELMRDFHCVTINHPPGDGEFDHVCPDFSSNIDLCLAKLPRTGAERVGLVLKRIFHERTAAADYGRFFLWQGKMPVRERIPLCLMEDTPEAKSTALVPWIEQWKPSVILARDFEISAIVEKALPRRRRPRIIQLQLNELTPRAAGIDERNSLIASTAVEILVGKLLYRQAQRVAPRQVMIRGIWKER